MVEEFQQRKGSFLQEIVDVVMIPPQLILNWDQTGLQSGPSSFMDDGSKRVEIQGLDDKRQITGVFQLIHGGKTDRCHPPYPFPSD